MGIRTLSVLIVAGVAASCGGSPAAEPPECADAPSTVVIYAASSLREGFAELAPDLAGAAGCETEVVFEFGSSGALAARIAAGSPAQVFVSAGPDAMSTVVDSGEAVGTPSRLLANDASLMVSSRSEIRDDIRRIEDLLDNGVLVGLCVPTAPCGALADDVLANVARATGTSIDRARVADTETASSADLITKLSLGELDAGIVLSSECVLAARDTVCRALPSDVIASTVYGVVALDDSAPVRRIVEAVGSPSVIDRLVADHGFSRIVG